MTNTVQPFKQDKQAINSPRLINRSGRDLWRNSLRNGLRIFFCLFTVALLSGETRYFESFGWRVYSDEVNQTAAGLELGTTYLRLPADLGYIRLSFPSMIFDETGKLKSCVISSEELQFTDINGLQVAARSYQLKDQGAFGAGLYLSGTVLLTTAGKTELNLQFTSLDMYLTPAGEIRFAQVQEQSTPSTLSLAGWDLEAGKISTGLINEAKNVAGTIVENISLTLPDKQTKLVFARLCLDVDGLILEAGENREPGSLFIKGWQLQYQASRFSNEGLAFTQVQLAGSGVGSAGQVIPAIQLKPDGTLMMSKSEAFISWAFGEFLLQLNQYQLKNETIQAREIQLTFPSALGNKQLKAGPGKINASGILTANDVLFGNLELFGFVFSLSVVQFQTEQVNFTGQVLEPYARLTYPLQEFSIAKDGTVNALTVVAEDNQPQPLLDKEWG